jgi:hypothetical protein
MTKQVQYPYAYDENNNLVFVGDIEREHRHDHTYHCPGCGQSMLPRLGDINANHFYHSEGQACGIESYIHATAKVIIANRFNAKEKPFKIGLTSELTCRLADVCKEEQENCRDLFKYKEYDLTSYYQNASVEERFLTDDNQVFQPDVILHSCNTERKDIFIEVFYKHKSSSQKIESGQQIIEIRIRSFDDLKSLAETDCFKESEDLVFHNFKNRIVSPEIIAETISRESFENDPYLDCLLPPCKQPLDCKRATSHLRKCVIYKSGKYFDMGILEGEENDHKPSALIEIVYNATKINTPLKILAIKDHKYRFCELCDNCITSYEDGNRWCRLVKNGSKRKGTFDNAKGTYCAFFKWSESSYNPSSDSALVEGVDYTIWHNPTY